MSAEEKPPEKIESDPSAISPTDGFEAENALEEPVEAQFADVEAVDASIVEKKPAVMASPPALAGNLENMSANGGRGRCLGPWALVCAGLVCNQLESA